MRRLALVAVAVLLLLTIPALPAEAHTTGRIAPAATSSVWNSLAACESGGNWAINTGNGYYGGIQFSLRSWRWVGGRLYPHQNTKAEQIYRGQRLYVLQGWGAWPGCSHKLGLR